MNAVVDFDVLYREHDPFRYRTSWYEKRKRDLLLAMLPAPLFADAWEWGCSNGELTAGLASRCARLLATDVSRRALALAQARVGDAPQVVFEAATHPREWPARRFDLVVFSEVGYYLDAHDFAVTVDRLGTSLVPTGTLVACHWKPAFDEAHRTGGQVHAALAAAFGDAGWHYEDEDFVLDAWSGDTRSLAGREGLR